MKSSLSVKILKLNKSAFFHIAQRRQNLKQKSQYEKQSYE